MADQIEHRLFHRVIDTDDLFMEEVHERRAWCNDNIGPDRWAYDAWFHTWYFGTQADATLFSLTWL
jgi:hypothetical protein